MQDFNDGCAYVSNKTQKTLRLRLNASYTWLVPDDWDTTVNPESNCAYDRSSLPNFSLKLSFFSFNILFMSNVWVLGWS